MEPPGYLADAKGAGITEAEREKIIATLAADPAAGDEIRGTGGARKLRFAGRGKGKSGSYRVITFYSGPDVPVSLLNVLPKAAGWTCPKPTATSCARNWRVWLMIIGWECNSMSNAGSRILRSV